MNARIRQATIRWCKRLSPSARDRIKYVTSLDVHDDPIDNFDIRILLSGHCTRPYFDKQLVRDLFAATPKQFQHWIRLLAGVNHNNQLTDTETDQVILAVWSKLPTE